jgi:hypothetical protein
MTLAQPTVLLSNACKPTSLATLVHWVGDPANSRITTNGFVIRVYKDNLVVLVDTILVHPVRVQDSQVSAPLANTLLCRAPETTLELQMVDTLTNGFTVSGALGHRFFAVTPPDTDTVDNVALLCFVAKTASLVGARRTGRAMDNIQLSVFPAPNTEKEAEDI